MGSIWGRCEADVGSMWGPRKVNIESLWGRWGVGVRSMWGRCRVDVVSIWGRCGVYVRLMWGWCKIDAGWMWGRRGVDVVEGKWKNKKVALKRSSLPPPSLICTICAIMEPERGQCQRQKMTLRLSELKGAIHSTKIFGNFGPKLNGSVRSNRKSFEKTGPPFEVDHFSRSDRLEFWLNGSRPKS